MTQVLGLREKNKTKTVLFSYIFTSTTFDSPSQPGKKGKIQCLRAQIALVLQLAL